MGTMRDLAGLAGPVLAKMFPRNFGLYEILATGSMEWMRRHLRIVSEVERWRHQHPDRRLTILDFGGADGSLARALRLYGLRGHYHMTLADIDRETLDAAPTTPPIYAKVLLDPSGGLPFQDAAFDIVVSSDVFEHIPAHLRLHWARECARVAAIGQVHSMPLDARDGTFNSSNTDRAFQEWHVARFGAPDRWTDEHLANGAPLAEDARSWFPGSRLSGIVNSDVWLETMHWKHGRKDPATRMLLAFRYVSALRPSENVAPFKNGIFVAPGLDAPAARHSASRQVASDREIDQSLAAGSGAEL